MKKLQKEKVIEVLVNIGFFFLFFLFFQYVDIQPGDDEIFIGFRQQYSIVEFVKLYYNTWSGRVFSNALIYIFAGLPIIYWQLFMALIMTVFGRTIFHFFSPYRIDKPQRNFFLLILCYLGVFLFSSAVLIPSVFWLTGSLNYIVPVTFALLGFTPFFRMLKTNETPMDRFWAIYIIPIVFTSLSNEQVSIGLWLITLGSLLLAKHRKVTTPRHLIFLNVLIILSTAVSITSPGNWLRLQQETQVWFNEYINLNLFERIVLAFGFSLSTIVNQWYYLMGLLWAATAVQVLSNAKKRSSFLLSILLGVYTVAVGLRFISSIDLFSGLEIFTVLEPLFTFAYLSDVVPINFTNIFVYFFWCFGLALLPITWLKNLKANQCGLEFSYIFFVALMLIFMVGFSPTLFVSGGRTSLVPNVLLLVIFVRVLWQEKQFLMLTAPTLLLIAFKIGTLLHRWIFNGYFVDYGLLTLPNLLLP